MTTENQPVSENTEAPSGEPAQDLRGYKTVQDLVAAKEASDAEALRMAQELKELRQRTKEAATPAPPAEDANDPGTFEHWVEKKDPVALRQAQFERAVYLDKQLSRIKDDDERAETEKRFVENQHVYGDINAAHQAVLADRRAKALAEREAEIARLQKELQARDANRPNPNVAHTQVREVTASQHQTRKMSLAQFDAQVKALEDSGDEAGARQLRQELRNGQIDYS